MPASYLVLDTFQGGAEVGYRTVMDASGDRPQFNQLTAMKPEAPCLSMPIAMDGLDNSLELSLANGQAMLIERAGSAATVRAAAIIDADIQGISVRDLDRCQVIINGKMVIDASWPMWFLKARYIHRWPQMLHWLATRLWEWRHE